MRPAARQKLDAVPNIWHDDSGRAAHRTARAQSRAGGASDATGSRVGKDSNTASPGGRNHNS